MREGASNRQDRTAHTGSHTFLTTQLSRHERHEEHPPFIADFPKRFRNYKSWEPVPSAGDIPSASPDRLNDSLFSCSICRSSF